MRPDPLERHDARKLASVAGVPRGELPPLPLDDERIDLWCVPFADLGEGDFRSRCLGLLSDAERAAMDGIRLAEDRDRYLFTRATVRTALSRYSDTSPHEWVFVSNRYGKPAICSRTHGSGQPSFNLSHTRSAIVLAVASFRALGVDVENEQAWRPLDPCDRDVLGPNEQAALARLPAARQRRRFLELWTLKEAYVKARGTGFALRPECVEFGFPGAHTLVFRPQSLLDDQADRWHFWQFRLAPDLLVALCVERLGCRPDIVLRGSAPLAVEGMHAVHADSWCLRPRTERRHDSFPIGRVRARPDLLS